MHAVTDASGRHLLLHDHWPGLRLHRRWGSVEPAAEWLIAARAYDANWFRKALKNIGIRACIRGRKLRGKPVRYDRHRIEIMFGRLKDWRRIATRYDRCPPIFLSAIALAATVMFGL